MISHVHVSQCCKINIDSGRSLTVIVSAPPLFFCVNKLLMSDWKQEIILFITHVHLHLHHTLCINCMNKKPKTKKTELNNNFFPPQNADNF